MRPKEYDVIVKIGASSITYRNVPESELCLLVRSHSGPENSFKFVLSENRDNALVSIGQGEYARKIEE